MQAQNLPFFDNAEGSPNLGNTGNDEEREITPQFFDFDRSKRPDKAYDVFIYQLTGSPNSTAEALEALSRQVCPRMSS